MTFWHWLLVHTGTVNEAGPWYAWWSGFASDIGEFAIIGGLVAAYKKHNCHVSGCWRIARHPVEGTPYIVCRKHHPTVPKDVTVEHVAQVHNHPTNPRGLNYTYCPPVEGKWDGGRSDYHPPHEWVMFDRYGDEPGKHVWCPGIAREPTMGAM